MAARIGVTDTALVRWLQRSGAADTEQLRDVLARSIDRAYQAGANLGVANFIILADGLAYVVRDGTLVSVLEDTGTPSRARAMPAERPGTA